MLNGIIGVFLSNFCFFLFIGFLEFLLGIDKELVFDSLFFILNKVVVREVGLFSFRRLVLNFFSKLVLFFWDILEFDFVEKEEIIIFSNLCVLVKFLIEFLKKRIVVWFRVVEKKVILWYYYYKNRY